MDGNGRWASRRGVSVAEGHRAGSRALRPIVETALDLGVESLAVYAFSTENWTRSEEEIGALMETFAETIERELPDLVAQGVRVHFIGRRDRAPEDLQERMVRLERETKRNDRLSLWIAFDYGGRAELVEATRRLVASGVAPEDVDENTFAAQLYAPAMPDPDLLIRTSGELRISNFLLWQLAYSELVFVDTLWPDFGASSRRVRAYARRRRRSAVGSSSRKPVRRDSSLCALDTLQPLPDRRNRDGMNNLASRVLVVLVGLPVVLGVVWLGGWWLCVLAGAVGLLALHEFYVMTRALRPIVIAGYLGLALTLVRRRQAGSSGWPGACSRRSRLPSCSRGLPKRGSLRPSRSARRCWE